MNTLAEKTKVEIFEIEHLGETIIVIPTEELGESDFQRIEAAAKVVLQLLESPAVQNVVMDFHKIDYYGSTALAFFVRLWKRVRKHRGAYGSLQYFGSWNGNTKDHQTGPILACLSIKGGGGHRR